MKKIPLMILTVFVLLITNKALPTPGERALAPRHQSWLDMVDAIASQEEKQIFRKLDNERDRDAFMAIFWRQRDPSPGTAENEYQQEIVRRFEHVQSRFSGGSGPGWKTDRGRFYMILGEPRSMERFDEHMELYPIQVWTYAGNPEAGLPPYFHLTFFRPRGGGEWKLYDPALDGPGALLHGGNALIGNNAASELARIGRIAPSLVGPAQSMLPGEGDVRGTIQDSILLARIVESPTRRIGSGYAADFTNYKSFVDVESSVHYVPCSGLVALTWEPRLNGVLAVVSLKPRLLTLIREESEDEHVLRLRLTVNVQQRERLVHHQVKEFRATFPVRRVEGLQRSGVAIHEAFPLVPGRYQVRAFIVNTDSQEFSYFDQELEVPDPDSGLALGTPLIGFRSETQDDARFYPFRFLDHKLFLDPEASFGTAETPVLAVTLGNVDRESWETGHIEVEVEGSRENAAARYQRKIPLRDRPYAASMSVILPLEGYSFPPDYYRLVLRVRDGAGKLLQETAGRFVVSPAAGVAHPVELYKAFSERYPAQFDWVRAIQYENLDRLPEAERKYAETLKREPGLSKARAAYARLLNHTGKPRDALTVLEPLRGNAQAACDYHALRGEALFALERQDEALVELEAALRIGGSDYRLLNRIGHIRLKRQETDEALRIFKESLALRSDQADITALVARLDTGGTK